MAVVALDEGLRQFRAVHLQAHALGLELACEEGADLLHRGAQIRVHGHQLDAAVLEATHLEGVVDEGEQVLGCIPDLVEIAAQLPGWGAPAAARLA